jgi:uncharacterized protein YbjT (DUF2867 family)
LPFCLAGDEKTGKNGPMSPVVGIAGATGFVGRGLVAALKGTHRVVALTRKERRSEDPALEWRATDLFSLADAERALEGVEVAIYLVHSMLPSAQLTQGSFADMDLILADNFARAAAKAGVKRIVYLGGLTPREAKLSKHLASRLEVEQALRCYGTPVTAVRASIVVGPGGSSFDILTQLNRRLPAMITPAWSQTQTQPIELEDLIRLLCACVDSNPPDLVEAGGPDVLTYREMLETVGELLGKRRKMINVPLFSPGLSKLWVRLVTGAPKELVNPLIDSLRHDMVVLDPAPQEALAQPTTSFREAARHAIAKESARRSESWRKRRDGRDVRSVQRLPLPPGKDARWVAATYLAWLPTLFRRLIRAEIDPSGDCRFLLFGIRKPLLDLKYAPERSSPELALFSIAGGLLVRRHGGNHGTLEFRVVEGGRYVIAAIHDYRPALPWPIYRRTQALVHLAVMRLFGRFLAQSSGN